MLFSLCLVVFYNLATWHALVGLTQLQGIKAAAFYASFAIFLWAAITLLLTPFSFRPTLKPVLSLVALCSAAAAYFMNTYGITIDTVMMQNVLETNPGEAKALLSGRLFLYLGLLGALPIALIWLIPVTYRRVLPGLVNKVLVCIGCVLVIAASVGPSRALVASSRISTRGSASRARAMPTRWRSPPDNFRPRSPTVVS